jgi:hypothetical protein
MKSLIISPKNKEELKFVESLLNKLGVTTKALTEEEIEDAGLSLLMKAVDRTKKVSKEVIMKKLKA